MPQATARNAAAGSERSGGRAFRLPNPSIFWRTLALVLGALIVAQCVSIGLIALLPAPRPDFATMLDLTEAASTGRSTTPDLVVGEEPRRPEDAGRGMVEQDRLTSTFARMMAKPVRDVVLRFEPDQSEVFPFPKRTGRGAVPMRHGQAWFFNTVEAAVLLPSGRWRVVRTTPHPVLTAWQRRTIIWFAMSVLTLAVPAWLFARALTRPIRRLEIAANDLSAPGNSSEVPEEGPGEIRRTAAALNAMRRSLDEHVRERAAMIGAIAHDLRTPLARVAFRIERLAPEVREPIAGDLEQMREMISATIAFVRGDQTAMRFEEIDLGALVRDLTDLSQVTDARVEVDDDGVAVVPGDRIALRRLAQNLIDNALAYGGSAVVRIVRDGARVRMTVSDVGPGIDPAMLERVFEPFVREPSRNRDKGGVGLGLTIARTIARSHGGEVTAENLSSGGLRVTVLLPSATTSTPPVPRRLPESPWRPRRRPRHRPQPSSA